MLKRFIAIILIIILTSAAALILPSCKDGEPDDGKIKVVATIFAPYDFVREIAGDKINITMLLPPASESHSFEPTAQDIIKIQNCDVFIYVGSESDVWVDRILDSMDEKYTENKKIITLMECVDVVEEEIVEGMEENEQDDDDEPEYDEHVWTSPQNAKLIVRAISDVLCEIDDENAETYRQNTASYITKLDDLDRAFRNVVDNAARKTIVFGDRFPFRYFVDAYGLDYFAAFPGCSTETEPSAKTIAFLIEKIKETQIPVVFHAEMSNGKVAETISGETGAKVLTLHSCHNISKDDFSKGATYLELMTKNVDALKEALQ